ncbi:MAG: homocysteine S-methyltransferase family protein, partial [Nocardioides sp.]
MIRPDATDRLRRALATRLLIIDGAMGTMLQGYGLTEADYRGSDFADSPVDLRGNSDILSLSRPDIVSDIHGAYLAAGADIVCTNTFTASSISQADYGLAAISYDLNRAAAELARAA